MRDMRDLSPHACIHMQMEQQNVIISKSNFTLKTSYQVNLSCAFVFDHILHVEEMMIQNVQRCATVKDEDAKSKILAWMTLKILIINVCKALKKGGKVNNMLLNPANNSTGVNELKCYTF